MTLDPADAVALWLTLKLATATTLLVLAIGTPLAWWLATTTSRARVLVGACVALPLVLPPTVLGFYLLLLLGNNGPVGKLTASLGLGTLAFTFGGLLIASVIYSLPFAVQPLQAAFEQVGAAPLEAAAVLRAGPVDRFLRVAVPLAAPGFLAATVLAFAHAVGEFGIVLMIGGNIPGRTETLAIAIYNHVEALEYGHAHRLAGGLVAVALIALLAVYRGSARRGSAGVLRVASA
jgi:molybdate transport system permease protein